MSELPAKVEVTEDGRLRLSDKRLAAILESHLTLLDGLVGVDRAMLAQAAEGSVQAATLIYKRLGLLRDRGSVTKPEMPDIPTHELQAELVRRGMLVEAETKDPTHDAE